MVDSLQSAIEGIGLALFAGVRRSQPRLLSASWIDDRLMAMTMRDERLKVQAFRFIDALPGLADDHAIVSHLKEYLAPVAPALPGPLRLALAMARDGALPTWLVARVVELGARRLARRFIAGATTTETVSAARRLRRRHLAFTVDVLGEAVLADTEADAYRDHYLGLIDGLADAAAGWDADPLLDCDQRGPIPRVNVSVKLSALCARFDPSDPNGVSREVRTRLRPLLARARARGAFVNVDMEQSSCKELVLRILRDVLDEQEFHGWADVGVAIQAYLRSAADDLAGLHDWARRRGTPLWIRLVKGAYHDHERVVAAQNGWPVPVFTHKTASDANYEHLSRFLIERHEVLRPAFASHNVRSIAHALALAEEAQLPAGAIEFQMLFGMAGPLKEALAARGQRVRIYVPVGRLLPGMAYLVRRLLENTSNQSFVRVGFLEHHDERELLMPPIAASTTAMRTPAPGVFVNEPPADFSRAEVRAAMDAALAGWERRLASGPLSCPVVIGEERLETGRSVVSRDPSHQARVICCAAAAGSAEAARAVAAARAAFPAWRSVGAEARAGVLERAAAGLAARRMELTALIVIESGKARAEADADVAEAIDFCRYYAQEARRLDHGQASDVPGETNRQLYEPRGVAVVIAPWNFPLAILCGMTAAALVTGNTVVMKPAEQTPGIAVELHRVLREAGVPPDALALLPGIGEEVGPALVAHPDVSLIAFTGSLAVGLAINRAAAAAGGDEVKRVICEMGGKNAIIVDADADLDEAVQGVVASAFGYQGQKCSACSRAIVLDAVYDRFLERLVEAVRSLRLGPAEDPGAAIGPVIDREARDRIRARIAAAGAEARLVHAGTVPPELDAEGCYVAPHVYADVAPSCALAQEEIFGPVLAVLRARDLDQAIAIANGTRYALTGGCYSRSPAALERMRCELRVGNLYLNRRITGALVGRQPFGGFRLSGIGSKAGGPDYLLQFTVPRCVTENTMRHGFTPDL